MSRPAEITGRKLLRYADLKPRGISFCRVHIRRLEAANKFPQHIELGENSIAWFEDELDCFLEEKAAARTHDTGRRGKR